MEEAISMLGLCLTLAGASLLFFYGLPKKKWGNVIIYGSAVIKYEPDEGERDIPESEWQPIADEFQKKAKLLNSTGFALVAAGTLLQMIPIAISM
jgi:hypothetical protein